MSMTCTCYDGDHVQCAGKVSKWYADPGDTILENAILASDGVGVYVACTCNCHATVSKIEIERVEAGEEWVS